jgi:hypothetical protein
MKQLVAGVSAIVVGGYVAANVPVRAAEPGGVRAPLNRIDQRKPAPAFRLPDASGKLIPLSKYRGKVVLLDFWATE